MSLLSKNVIPGNHGKIFETNAKDATDLADIKSAILKIKGIRDVIINMEVFPREIIVHTETLVKIESIEKAVKKTGFHAIPRALFHL